MRVASEDVSRLRPRGRVRVKDNADTGKDPEAVIHATAGKEGPENHLQRGLREWQREV